MSEFWDNKRKEINALLKELQSKPDNEKMGYQVSPGGILNAYREGDVSFNDAVRGLNKWASARRQAAYWARAALPSCAKMPSGWRRLRRKC